MSNSIDRRVVEMVFDNSRFENNARTTMGTLDRLKQSLKFTEGTKAFENVNSAAANVNLSPIEQALLSASNRFSTFGIVGATIIQNLTNKAIQLGSKLLHSINAPIAQIKSGGMRRALNLEQAKFQLKGLGIAWDQVSDSIDAAVNGTRFGLDSAAKAASQLAASQVQLGDDMTTALRGISGVAAMTNSEYDDIAHVFTRVAGNGRVFATDLQSISARGLNAAATLAKYYKEVEHRSDVTEASIRDMVSKGEVDFKTFASAMNWAFGEQATKANDTFTGALANTKAALSRIGAEFYIPGLELMRNIFVDLIPRINGVKSALKPLTDTFSKFVSVVTMGKNGQIIHRLFDALTIGIKNVTGFIPYFKTGIDVARQAMFGFDSTAKELSEYMPKRFKKLTKGLKQGTSEFEHALAAMNIAKIFQEISKSLKNFFESIKPSERTLQNFAGTVSGVAYFIGIIGEAISRVIFILSPLTAVIRRVITFILEVGNSLGIVLKTVYDAYGSVFTVGHALHEGAKTLSDFLVDKIDSLSAKLSVFTDNFRNKWLDPNKFWEFTDSVAESLSTLIEAIKPTEETIQNMKDTFDGLIAGVEIVWKVFKNLIGLFIPSTETLASFLDVIKSIGEVFFSVTGNIGRFLQTVNNSMDGTSKFGEVLKSLKGVVGIALQSVFGLMSDILTNISKIFSEIDLSGIFQSIKKFFSDIFNSTGAGNALSNILQNAADNITAFTDAIRAGVNSEEFKRFLAFLGGSITSVKLTDLFGGLGDVKDIFGSIQAIFGKGEDEAGSPVGIIASLGEIKTAVLDTFGAFQDMLKAQKLKTLAEAILMLAAGLFLISTIESDKLISSCLAIASLFTMLTVAMKQLTKLEIPKNFDQTTVALATFSFSILLLAIAMKMLASLSWEDTAKGLLTVVTLMMALGEVVKRMPANGGNMKGIAKVMVPMALSIILLSVAMKMLAKLSWEEIFKGLLSVLALIAALGAFTKYSGIEKVGARAGLALVLIGASMLIFAKAVGALGKMDPVQLAIGLGALFAVLASLMFFIKSFDKYKGKLVTLGIAMVAMGAGIDIISKAINRLGTMNPKELGQGLLGLGAALLAFSLSSKYLSAKGGAALIMLATGITILAVALKILGTMNTDQLIAALVTMGIAIGGLAVASMMITPAMVATMLGVAGAVALLGVAALAFGAGILMLSIGLVTLAGSIGGVSLLIIKLGSAIAQGIAAFLDSVAEAIPQMTTAGIKIITGFLKGVAENIGDVVDTAVTIVTTFLDTLTKRLPELVESGVNFIVTFVESLATSLDENRDRISDAVVNLIATILGILWDSIKKLAKRGWEMIKGLKDSFEEHYPEAAAVLKNLPGKIWDFIKEKWNKLKETGKEIIKNIKDGIVKKIEDIKQWFLDLPGKIFQWLKDGWQKLKDAGSYLMEGLKEGLESRNTEIEAAINNTNTIINKGITKPNEINSPSKLWMRYGKYLIDGLVIGMNQNRSSAGKAARNTAISVNRAFHNALDILESDDFTPTITPVVDLSNVYQSANQMNGIFGSLEPNTGLAITGSIGDIRPGSAMMLDASTALEKTQTAMAETLDKLIRDGLIDAQAVYTAVRDGASMATMRINLNDRELSRGLRDMGVVFR